MKRIIIFLTFISFYSAAHSVTNSMLVIPVKQPLRAEEVYLPVGNTGRLISLMDLSRISVKDFETLSGEKMKFSEKVQFKLSQRQLKKSINEDGTFSRKSIEKYLTKLVDTSKNLT